MRTHILSSQPRCGAIHKFLWSGARPRICRRWRFTPVLLTQVGQLQFPISLFFFVFVSGIESERSVCPSFFCVLRCCNRVGWNANCLVLGFDVARTVVSWSKQWIVKLHCARSAVCWSALCFARDLAPVWKIQDVVNVCLKQKRATLQLTEEELEVTRGSLKPYTFFGGWENREIVRVTCASGVVFRIRVPLLVVLLLHLLLLVLLLMFLHIFMFFFIFSFLFSNFHLIIFSIFAFVIFVFVFIFPPPCVFESQAWLRASLSYPPSQPFGWS